MGGRVPARAVSSAGCVAIALTLVGVPRSGVAQEPPSAPADGGWIGKRVVTYYGAVLNDNRPGGTVDDAERSKNLDVSGKDRGVFRVYRVGHVSGNWLWLRQENGPAEGWVDASWALPLDQAIDYYTEQIRSNPCAANYSSRANIWVAKGEPEIAIADYNEAIRLDPRDGASYIGRGLAWSALKRPDRAIADYGQAIRIDPRDALAYRNRGNAWRAKAEYDEAITDYNEALRIDPRLALAYNGRGNAWRGKREFDKAAADYARAIELAPRLAWPYFGRAVVALITGQDAEGDARAAVERDGWRSEAAAYAALIGHVSARRSGREAEARRWLDDAAREADRNAWPYPIVRFLRREIDEPALLAAATDDADNRTEAHCFLGLDDLLAGRVGPARDQFRWVKEHGVPSNTEYTVAVVELDRLAAKASP